MHKYIHNVNRVIIHIYIYIYIIIYGYALRWVKTTLLLLLLHVFMQMHVEMILYIQNHVAFNCGFGFLNESLTALVLLCQFHNY